MQPWHATCQYLLVPYTKTFHRQKSPKTAVRHGKKPGLAKGSKLVTKKSIQAKTYILKHSKSFGGELNNEQCWKLAGISKDTFYKYKKELVHRFVNNYTNRVGCGFECAGIKTQA